MTESEIWFQDPYTAFARGRQSAGPSFVPTLGAWVVARHDDVLDVLRRADEFSSANTLPRDDMLPPAVRAELADSIGGRPVVVNSDGAAHRRYRAPLLGARRSWSRDSPATATSSSSAASRPSWPARRSDA
jgi:cytochrome P450